LLLVVWPFSKCWFYQSTDMMMKTSSDVFFGLFLQWFILFISKVFGFPH
jgi:hypothetical protein